MNQRIFSGIQPSGSIHIGNYAGAIRNWVELQKDHECIYCIVDYHAMTIPYEPRELPQRVLEAALDILACGVDPERSLLFVQSHVPEHCELSWILGCTAPMGELNRMTQFKEKSERVDSVTVGLFTYPVLQSADILLYKADTVPVGEDQLQHLELTREVARRFNARYGETFPEPKPRLTPSARVMDLSDPTRKMSKSVEGSAIMLSDSDEVIANRIKRAVTDVGPAGPEMSAGVKNLFTLLEATAGPEVVAHFYQDYEEKKLRYSELKAALTESMLATLGPIRERRAELAARPEKLREILGDSARRCRTIGVETLREVREKCGLGAGMDPRG